ncbi:MAG: SAM-dependent methyltransferase [Tardiphaga sp.]|nr:SAM-dependent methyltransferase [Tardiphaga sp.]
MPSVERRRYEETSPAMTDPSIRFNDGAAYERMMGAWSHLAGDIFLDWLAPEPGLAWVDVGCGNGAFTELIVQRLAPCEVHGVDPSDGQLRYARTRPGTEMATFHQGDAMALPFANNAFDAAVMALVIFFVPEPSRGVSEMARVVAPGGMVAAYAWDMDGGGFPLQPVMRELRAMGLAPPLPPSPDASRIDHLQRLWRDAGLKQIETRRIDVTRHFADFEDFWAASTSGSTVKPMLAEMTPQVVAELKARVRAHLTEGAAGGVSCDAFANAVKGRVPD